jgi:hypothetical protein
MVVRDLDFVGIAVLPAETEAVLLVDPDTELAGSISAEALQTISWRNSQFLDGPDAVQLVQLPASNGPQRYRAGSPRSAAINTVEQVLGCAIRPRAYHASYYNGARNGEQGR